MGEYNAVSDKTNNRSEDQVVSYLTLKFDLFVLKAGLILI